jgi:hypothetical protein
MGMDDLCLRNKHNPLSGRQRRQPVQAAIVGAYRRSRQQPAVRAHLHRADNLIDHGLACLVDQAPADGPALPHPDGHVGDSLVGGKIDRLQRPIRPPLPVSAAQVRANWKCHAGDDESIRTVRIRAADGGGNLIAPGRHAAKEKPALRIRQDAGLSDAHSIPRLRLSAVDGHNDTSQRGARDRVDDTAHDQASRRRRHRLLRPNTRARRCGDHDPKIRRISSTCLSTIDSEGCQWVCTRRTR